MLLLFVSDCVTCYHTVGPNVATCEISPEQTQFCHIECVLRQSSYICTQGCVNSDSICSDNITTADFVTYCCSTPYCNVFNGSLSTSTISNAPSPSTSELHLFS